MAAAVDAERNQVIESVLIDQFIVVAADGTLAVARNRDPERAVFDVNIVAIFCIDVDIVVVTVVKRIGICVFPVAAVRVDDAVDPGVVGAVFDIDFIGVDSK